MSTEPPRLEVTIPFERYTQLCVLESKLKEILETSIKRVMDVAQQKIDSLTDETERLLEELRRAENELCEQEEDK